MGVETVIIFCSLPLILIAGVIGFFIGLSVARRADPRSQFADLVQFWRQTQQIDQATADRLLKLLWSREMPRVAESVELDESRQVPSTDVADGIPAPAQPVPEPMSMLATRSASDAPLSSLTVEPIAPPDRAPLPEGGNVPVTPVDEKPFVAAADLPEASRADRLSPFVAALLSLGMRRMLLAIGTFLVVVSSLVLVIFNWNSFVPVTQVGIIAALTAGLWGLGRWLEQREDFAAAGRNLSAVAALLVPVVAFSFTRPGLLNLDPPLAFLLVSGSSALLYTIGAWLSRRLFYSLAASVAVCATMISSFWQWNVAALWQPAWSFSLWLLASIVARWLAQRSAVPLALGPRILQWAGPPVSLLVSLSFFLADPTVMTAPATLTALALGAVFWGGLGWFDRQPNWWWATALILPVAALVGSVLPNVGPNWITQGFAALALGYVGLAAATERRSSGYALPLLAVAPVLGLVVIGATLDRSAVIRNYPLLIGTAGLALTLLERGRLVVLQARRALVGTLLLGLAIVLVAGWTAMVGETVSQRLFIALLVGGSAFLTQAVPMVGRIAYAPATCRFVGAGLVAFTALALVLVDVDLRILALALAMALYGWQAARARHSWWALSSLTAGVLFVAAGLSRLGWLATLEHYLLAGMGLAGLLGIGGSLLRHGSQQYWMKPALGWAGLLSGLSSLLLLVAFTQPGLIAVSAALLGSAGWVVMSAIWRRWWMGYPAATLLTIGWMLAVIGRFLDWSGGLSALAVLAVPLSAGYGLFALALRRWPDYDRPYAHFALGIALLIPLPALLVVLEHWAQLAAPAALVNLPLATIGSAAILAAGAVAYRRWRIASLSLIHLMIAVGGLAYWLAPRDGLVVGWTLLAAASATIIGSVFAQRRWMAPELRMIGRDSYGIGGVAGLVALSSLFTGDLSSLIWPLLVWALVTAIVTAHEQSEFGATLSLLALIGSMAGGLALTVLSAPWQAAWLALTLLLPVMAGWLAQRWPAGACWYRPTLWTPLVVGLLAIAIAAADMRALVVALVNAGVVLVTITVRERRSEYGYLAGAAFVAASLGQFTVWEVAEIQFYVIPVGAYLLVLANGIRHFQRNNGLARLVDTGAVVLLLGVTLIQAAGSASNIFFILLVGGESLLVAVYGGLLRLRVPFIGGIAGIVVSVLWLVANAALMLNQWLLLGSLGLLMLVAYVLLERQQAVLRRLGRDWALRLQQWR
ncbi:hypothetical protein [Chloroflexus sp.]|uniref:hypothetical protein n=1 Tax=Chloroflexus sp. TaxID=1904827 RepID=UPI002615C800|nr:hypothetical protein [uncultured Chloroflexus sp.]